MASYALILAATLIPFTLSHPQIITQPNVQSFCVVVDSTENVAGGSWQMGISQPSGANIALTESHEVGTTWEVGFSLGLSVTRVIEAAGTFSISVAETVSDGVSESGEQQCPPDGEWRCGMMITPGMTRISGHIHAQWEACEWPANGQVHDGDLYTALVPRTDSSGNGYWTSDICVCDNLLHNGDAGAPELKCRERCVVPGE